jgi:mono/diheme cytochrome c family protein
VCAQDRIGVFHTEDTAPKAETGKRYVAGAFGSSSVPRLGVFAALDMRTNKLVWQQQWSDECYSGSTTTAGGLTFVGRNDGRLTALDSKNGAKLWEFQTGAGMNAPVTVFEHDSKQYVVAYSAGNTFAASARGDSVWLFALDGALEPVPPPAAATLLTQNNAATAAADPAKGRRVYEDTCVFCHGDQGEGGTGGGKPLNDAREIAFVVQTVTEGRREMPPFAGALSPEQIRDVASYVTTKLPHH